MVRLPSDTQPAPEPAPRPPPPDLPERIGPYRVKRMLAHGGMGVVYEAEQDHPRRPVALKVMLDVGGSGDVLRRFEYEIEVLGSLRHPNIAQIHEAGTYRDGTRTLPYFAMEFVPDARSLTDYAAEQRLDRRARLALFLQVLEAIGHGHRNGVIHRDLKPGNLLVDAQGQVKVIDFGVARAANPDPMKGTVLTQVGQLVGTVRYMSPEQVEADPSRIDTRSDVYSLGVVLYELLSSRLPHDFTRGGIDAATRLIREEPPTRISTHDRSLRGDLETIVSKALEKERERRYSSVDELRRDIRAFLDGAAISARPPSVAYQLRVFARRNRVFVSAVAAVFVALAGGVVVSSSMYVRAERARREADEQSAVARAVNAFLNEDLLAAVDPMNTTERDITMRAVLDKAARGIGDRFGGQPLVEAAIRRTIGNTYVNLSALDAAEEHLVRAQELVRSARGERHRETLVARNDVAHLRLVQGRREEAERLFLELRRQQLEILGPEAEDTLLTALGLGALYSDEGRFAEAEPLLRETLEIRRRVSAPGSEETLTTMTVLGLVLADQGKQQEAEALYRETLELARTHHGPDHPIALATQNNLAWQHILRGRPQEAVELLLPTIEAERRVLGDLHGETLTAINNLAVAYKRMGRLDLAEPLYREGFEASARALGAEHPDTLVSATNLGGTYVVLGRYEEAAALLAETVDVCKRVLDPGFYGTAFTLCAYGESLLGLQRYDEAEDALLEARDILIAAFGPGNTNLGETDSALRRLYHATGRDDEAAELLGPAR